MILLGLYIACAFATYEVAFSEFKEKYGKAYDTKELEEERFQVFISNMELADEYNADPEDLAQYGVTQFMDLSPKEFSDMYLGYKPTEGGKDLPKWDLTCYSCSRFPSMKDVPEKLDWTTQGAVNPIKDQAQCGSCWAFSTVAGAEGAWFMAGNDLASLSEEEVVQCDTGDGNQGCQGGEMTTAYQWIMKHGGLNAEEAYPYTSGTGITGRCKTEKEAKSVASIDGAVYISKNGDVNEDIMVNATATIGPLSIGINAGHLQTYQKGILSPIFCPPQLDHGVAIVGYGEEARKFWKVRNSWGETWGEEGYFRIVRGEDKCGLARDVSVGYVKAKEVGKDSTVV